LMTWMEAGGVCNSCGLRVRELTPGYGSRRRHMETRGTSQVPYHYGACGRREGFLVFFSSHGGRGFVTWVVPSHIPAEDRSTNNGQDQKYGQDPHPTTEAILPTTRLRQPGARLVVLHLRNHTEPLPELITTLHALRQQRFFLPSSQDWSIRSEFDGRCFHRSSENWRNRGSRGL